MTNDELVKRLREQVRDLDIFADELIFRMARDAMRQAADAIEALTAQLATIEAATVERCAAEIRAKCQACNGTGHQGQDQCPYCGYPIDAIRALAPLDTEATVKMLARAMEAELRGRETIIRRADGMHIADVVAGDLERMARAALAAMGVGR